MKKLFLLFAVFFGVVMMFSGCSDDDNPANPGNGTPGENEVIIQGMTFSPGSRTVAVGTTIKWINRDAVVHTVTSGDPNAPSGVFDSGNLGSNGEFSYTFNTPGTFRYYCRTHPVMIGTIVVQ
jgi:plastocyanin